MPTFGPDYLIPRPFDPRLLVDARAGRRAARRWIRASRRARSPTWTRTRKSSAQFVYRTGLVMKPVYDRARSDLKRVVYAEGEEETVLRAVQTVIDEELARPILIGRPDVIDTRIAAPRPAHARRRRFRTDQHQRRPALQRLLAAVPRADRAPRRDAGGGEEPAALAPDADRRADGRARRSRRDDLRPGRPLPQEAGLHAQRVRLRPGRDRHRRR